MLGPQHRGLQRLAERLDLEHHVVFDEVGEAGPNRAIAERLDQLLHPAARVCLELLIAVQDRAECRESRERALQGDGVAHGYGTEVVQHELDVGRCDVLTDGEHVTAPHVAFVLYDFGAVSVSYAIPLQGPLTGLPALSTILYGNEQLQADSRRRVQQLVEALGEAALRSRLADFVED